MGVLVSKASYYANLFGLTTAVETITDPILNQSLPVTTWEVTY